MNRIDSRARGNAPQLLEKYRKLAHDAHLNGDRVTAEYYLQFADHYFRVLADTRLRQEEARARREDRWQEQPEPYREESEEAGEFTVGGDFPMFDQPPAYGRREREERPRVQRDEAPIRHESRTFPPRVEEDTGTETPNIYEPVENPFVRENRGPRTPRPPRRDNRRPRWEDRESAPAEAAEAAAVAASVTADPLPLPPAISTGRRVAAVEEAGVENTETVQAEPAPAPKRRTRRKPVSSSDEAFEPAA